MKRSTLEFPTDQGFNTKAANGKNKTEKWTNSIIRTIYAIKEIKSIKGKCGKFLLMI